MKIIILFVCIVLSMTGAAAIRSIIYSDLEKLRQTCLRETGGKPEIARKLYGKSVLPNGTVEKCFLTCIYKGLGIVSNNDTFLPERVKQIAGEFLVGRNLKITNKIVDYCSKEIKAIPNEECSIGKSCRACFAKKGQELGFFPYI